MRVISGGQTGADRTALEVAHALGIETGGTAPKGWKTDAGPDPALATFGLVESAFTGYRVRTIANVRAADGTVVFGRTDSPGCTLTIETCQRHSKPCIENPTTNQLVQWVRRNKIQILNVAGNRQRTNPAVVEQVRLVLTPALERLQRKRKAPKKFDQQEYEAWHNAIPWDALALDGLYDGTKAAITMDVTPEMIAAFMGVLSNEPQREAVLVGRLAKTGVEWLKGRGRDRQQRITRNVIYACLQQGIPVCANNRGVYLGGYTDVLESARHEWNIGRGAMRRARQYHRLALQFREAPQAPLPLSEPDDGETR